MLTICIPVYNVDVRSLLECLTELRSKIEVPCEILVVDDGSGTLTEQFNNKIAYDFGIRYLPLSQNIGRSAIRNYLCREALYDNLLFLDCDSVITSNNFLENYIPYLNQNMVIYGGTAYQKNPPVRNLRLHWNYGRKREIKPVWLRNNVPARYFKTNNFMIPKDILVKYPFNEKLKGYGHEDTLLAIGFSQNEIKVLHIDNPVLHVGLETNDVFISKTETGIRNLAIIRKEIGDDEILQNHIQLLRAYTKLGKYSMTAPVRILFLVLKPILLFLIRQFYFLKVFDFYKLGFLCTLNKKSTVLSNDALSGKI